MAKITAKDGYVKTNYKIQMAFYLKDSYRWVWKKDGRYFVAYAGSVQDVTDRKERDFIYMYRFK